jgi:hypothetical protein
MWVFGECETIVPVVRCCNGIHGSSMLFCMNNNIGWIQYQGQGNLPEQNLHGDGESADAGVDYHIPFGGRKGSSYGTREQGSYAKEFYTVVICMLAVQIGLMHVGPIYWAAALPSLFVVLLVAVTFPTKEKMVAAFEEYQEMKGNR